MASTDPQALKRNIPVPGDGLGAARIPGRRLHSAHLGATSLLAVPAPPQP